MNLFTTRVPWTEGRWYQAGLADAKNCVTPRYDGSDICEDVLRSYIFGYQEGERVNRRTVPCGPISVNDRTKKEGFTYEEASTLIPGILPESWKTPIVFLVETIACLATLTGVLLFILNVMQSIEGH